MPNEPDDLRSSEDHRRRPWAARADAVFVSELQRRDALPAGQFRQAVVEAIGPFGCSGCAGWVAEEFGGHRETAVIRTYRERGVAGEAFADPGGGRPGPAWSAAGEGS